MVSEFRRTKYLHVFYVFFDTDRSGSIDKADFNLATINIAKKRGYKVGEIAYEFLKDMLNSIWYGLVKSANGDEVVSVEEWVRIWNEYAKNPANCEKWQKLYAKCLFQVTDVTNDGAIDAAEFATVCESFGLSKKEASIEAFQKMAGGKNRIGWEDYEKLFNEYFTTDDVDAPGNNIFGELSSCEFTCCAD